MAGGLDPTKPADFLGTGGHGNSTLNILTGNALGSKLFGNKKDSNNVAAKLAQFVSPTSPGFGGTVYAPPDGSAPLTTLPQYGGAGGSYQAAQYYAASDFAKMFGRNPTQTELSSLAQQYMSGDPNIANQTGGQAALSQYYQNIANSPENLQKRQLAEGQAAYTKGQAGFDATTNAAFQQATGRAGTADELSHFGGLLATGQIDAYGLSQLIGQTAEAQQKQTQGYQDTLSKNLQSTQGDYFKNYINPSILSQTAAAGRDPNSSGVQQAEVQAGKQQNYDLQNYLANFGASQYGQSAQNQQGVYSQYLNQQYNNQNANTSYALGQNAYNQQQLTNTQNYNMNQNAYNNYLKNYGKSNAGSSALTGALGGAKLGAVGGPWGMLAGGVAGGVAGYGAGGGF
jgi:hypothetical protein